MKPIQIPWKTHYYYRNRLGPEQRDIYDRIFEGLQNWNTAIPMPPESRIGTVYEIYSMVLRDCPLFFHVDVSVRMIEGSLAALLPKYRLTQTQYEKQFRLVCDFVRESVLKLNAAGNACDKVRVIHDSMARHVVYFGMDEPDSHNVVGAILKRKAVCESIAKAFKLLCDANYIPCIVIFGRAASTDGVHYGTVSENDDRDNHAWNMVKIGSNWYNIDVTFDLGVMGSEDRNRIRYDYFCRSDKVFAVNHIPRGATVPQAEKDYSYYRATGRYVKNHTELRRLIRNSLVAGMRWINFEYDRYAGFSLDTILDAARAEITTARASSFAASMNEKMCVATIRLMP